MVFLNVDLAAISNDKADYHLKLFLIVMTMLIDYVPLCGYLVTFHSAKLCHVIKK